MQFIHNEHTQQESLFLKVLILIYLVNTNVHKQERKWFIVI